MFTEAVALEPGAVLHLSLPVVAVMKWGERMVRVDVGDDTLSGTLYLRRDLEVETELEGLKVCEFCGQVMEPSRPHGRKWGQCWVAAVSEDPS